MVSFKICVRVKWVDSFEVKRSVWIQPPGEFSVKTVASNDEILVAFGAEGECSEIYELVFDEPQ